ncbi:MAG: EamA family transporter [Gammaproteobacteria bacterium]|nr:EamA family transporter [Gammaproteobacteria bacterium]
MKVFLFALLAAMGNALFVYGQRGSQASANPFQFILAALVICTILFLIFAFANKAPLDGDYLLRNLRFILISGVGFFLTFIGFYWLYSQQGATNYIVYALLSILTTSIGVGIIIFREPFNQYHVIAGLLAVAAILSYGFGQHKLSTLSG